MEVDFLVGHEPIDWEVSVLVSSISDEIFSVKSWEIDARFEYSS